MVGNGFNLHSSSLSSRNSFFLMLFFFLMTPPPPISPLFPYPALFRSPEPAMDEDRDVHRLGAGGKGWDLGEHDPHLGEAGVGVDHGADDSAPESSHPGPVRARGGV